MIKAEFMEGLADALGVEASSLKPEMELAGIEGWSSMGLINVIALLNDAGVNAKVAWLRGETVKTVADILALAIENLEG